MFITFEGIEGSGKSTQCNLLCRYLDQLGYQVVCSKEPGGSQLGSHLREILLHKDSKSLSSKAELLLYLADRAQHVNQVILPALEQGKIVLVDRYADSTIAYQGYGRKLDLDLIQSMNSFVVSTAWPDLTFLLDLPVEIGLQRARSRNRSEKKTLQEGRFEAEDTAFHHSLRQGYLQLATQEPNRFITLQAKDSSHAIFKDIKGIINNYLPKTPFS